MRAYDRDLIRGGHYGQRSCEPHQQAEHMAAPTNAALVKKESPCQLGAVHTWPFAPSHPRIPGGSYRGKTGRGNSWPPRRFMTHIVALPQDFAVMQHVKRVAIPTYKFSVGYSMPSS